MKKQFTILAILMLGISQLSIAQTIWSQNFEGSSSLPTGWTQTTLANDGGWKVGMNTALQSQYFPINPHTNFLCTNDDGCNCDKSADFCKTASFDLTGVSNAYLSFACYYFQGSYNGVQEAFTVRGSTNGGTSWTDLQVVTGAGDWHTVYISLASLANSANAMIGFFYNDGGEWEYGVGLDDISVFIPVTNEISLTGVTPVQGSPSAYGIVNSNITLGGTIFNIGSSAITQFTAKYSDGTTTWSDVINCNVAPFTSYTYTNPTAYTIPSNGDHPLTYWVEMNGDNDMTNNNGQTTIAGVPFLPVHNVTFEEATGTWCGWCVRGIVFMDSMSHVHPTTTNLIAVHNGDPMVVTSYDAGVGGLIAGYPSVLVDRKEVIDPQDMATAYDNHIGDFGFADLTVAPTFNASSASISANVTAHFATSLTGDYRLALVVTEDDCHGTGSTWGQHNYYTNNAYGPMGGFESMPGTIPAAQMYYDWVARSISGSFNGQTGSLPGTINAGDTHNFTFNYLIPVDQNPSNMKVVALLINATTGQILNSAGAKIVTGINNINSSAIDFMVYPNPANNNMSVAFNLNSATSTTVTITDLMGRTVETINPGTIAAGSYSFNFDLSEVASGVYFANVITENGTVTKKFVKD